MARRNSITSNQGWSMRGRHIMKTNISPLVMQKLVQQAQDLGVSVDDLILTLLNRQSPSEFEIFERITDAFFALDAQWRFIYMNHEAENLLQRRAQDLIGKNIWDEFPEARGG
ncbi:MAG: hypothetical protein CUN52_11365, partial [Phototrophicales bacterium]